jgi:hypothetical protein
MATTTRSKAKGKIKAINQHIQEATFQKQQIAPHTKYPLWQQWMTTWTLGQKTNTSA